MDKPPQSRRPRSWMREIPEDISRMVEARPNRRAIGILAALTSAAFLGMTPIFGKQAILFGAPALAVVAIRTSLASLLLFLVMYLFFRPYLYIYPAGLLGCLLAGFINGLGSVFYYNSLARIEAGVGQLLFTLYPFFLVMWLILDRQLPTRLTIVRVGLAIGAVYLLTQTGYHHIDPVGILQMLVASALYALHIPINQRVLYDMPAPTVTAYTLLAMSLVVVPTYLISGPQAVPPGLQAWYPIFGLTMVTFFSRLTLFIGVKHLGAMQTALLGLSETLVTLFFAHFWLKEGFTYQQWIGVSLLVSSLILVIIDRQPSKQQNQGGLLGWVRPPPSPTDIPWQIRE